MKGLASYRMFFAHHAQQIKLAEINSLTALRSQVNGDDFIEIVSLQGIYSNIVKNPLMELR